MVVSILPTPTLDNYFLAGTLPPAVAPMFFQSQPPLHPSQLVALNPALLQYLLTHLNQPQQPHAQQLPQIHPMLNYQQFMQVSLFAFTHVNLLYDLAESQHHAVSCKAVWTALDAGCNASCQCLASFDTQA